MTKKALEKLYGERKKRFEQIYTDKQQLSQRISTLRVLLFLLMFAAIILFFSSNFEEVSWLYAFLVGIPIFAIVVKWHQAVFEEEKLLEQLVVINQKEETTLDTQEAQFDGGEEFADAAHDYALDLDLFGANSLFAFINRTSTAIGKQALAQWFKSPMNDVEQIKEHQQAVAALQNTIDFRQEFMAKGRLAEDSLADFDYLQEWVDAPMAFVNSTFWKIVRFVLPAITITALLYYIFTYNYLPLLGMGLLNFALLGVKSKYVGKEHIFIGKRQEVLKMYISLLHLQSQQDFEQVTLLQNINKNAAQAQTAFQKLLSIIRYFDQRLNIFVGLGLNLLILYDVQCLFALEKWKLNYKDYLQSWLKDVAQLEILISLSSFSYNNPEFSFPHLKKSEGNYIQAKNIGHPLIPTSERICSDVSLGEGQESIYIVTGSNMAGKSTFLRSVAINLLLAKMGAVVCAEHFEANLMHIITSMRVQDSISKNTSYFQAELQRMKHIVNTLEEGQPTFVILDEILKGTNSDDKLKGSQLLVHRFLSFNCIALIATHDLELGKMEDEHPQQIKNLCFESTIENDELSFDYQLNHGIAQNKNATFLLRKMGIVEVNKDG